MACEERVYPRGSTEKLKVSHRASISAACDERRVEGREWKGERREEGVAVRRGLNHTHTYLHTQRAHTHTHTQSHILPCLLEQSVSLFVLSLLAKKTFHFLRS